MEFFSLSKLTSRGFYDNHCLELWRCDVGRRNQLRDIYIANQLHCCTWPTLIQHICLYIQLLISALKKVEPAFYVCKYTIVLKDIIYIARSPSQINTFTWIAAEPQITKKALFRENLSNVQVDSSCLHVFTIHLPIFIIHILRQHVIRQCVF